jgi:hypothetical protein
VLADGKTVMFGTFTCGLYVLSGVEGADPRLQFVHSFPGDNCAVPVVSGHFWIQTVPALGSLVALDVSNPTNPKEVSRLAIAPGFEPHWLARDASGTLLVTNDGDEPRLFLVTLDPETGQLRPHARFPVITLDQVAIDGTRRAVIPHGTVFAHPTAR